MSSLAALAGVWNGRKGHVALILRDIEPAAIERIRARIGDAPEHELAPFRPVPVGGQREELRRVGHAP